MSEIDYKAVQIDVLEFDNDDVIVTSECDMVHCVGYTPDTCDNKLNT